ncbi:MAG: single-stranded-DNA-specific exonuclease RecJ [bacterium]
MAIFNAEPVVTPKERNSISGTRWINKHSELDFHHDDMLPALRGLLCSRGIKSAEEADAFLDIDINSLGDPFLLPDMLKAAEKIDETIRNRGRIRIFGDYDTDGITSCALLVRAFNALSGQELTDWYIPHRIDDGYGLNADAIDAALADGISLGITVDNGITSIDVLQHAQDIGLPMIVTDHHEPGENLPVAVAVVNPKIPGHTYPYRELAGVGVAYNLLRAVCKLRKLPDSAPQKFLDLTAIGTIADVAPLLGENRIIAHHGLLTINHNNRKIGIPALLRAADITTRVNSRDVAFKIAPRLNAAGRVAHAETSLKLLLSKDPAEADQLARSLCQNNAERQEEEKSTLESALAMVTEEDLATRRVLVLSSQDWHPGVIGIVASRLVDRFNRPCVMIAVENKVGKGSARARDPFHLWEALDECSKLLNRFGGHRVAAGFEIKEANIKKLREAIDKIGHRTLTEEDLLPRIEIDGWAELCDVTTNFAYQVEKMQPFGMGNPEPTFAIENAIIDCVSARGTEGQHLNLMLRANQVGRCVSAIWFNAGEYTTKLRSGDKVDIAGTISLNTYMGTTTAQLKVKDIRI